MDNLKFKIKNLTCDACVKLARIKLSKINGIKDVRISDINGDTEIIADRRISLAEVEKSLENTNYQVNK